VSFPIEFTYFPFLITSHKIPFYPCCFYFDPISNGMFSSFEFLFPNVNKGNLYPDILRGRNQLMKGGILHIAGFGMKRERSQRIKRGKFQGNGSVIGAHLRKDMGKGLNLIF